MLRIFLGLGLLYNDSSEASEIELASALDCPQYRSLFYIIKGLPVDRRIEVRVIDLPPGCYGGAMTRDRWMADQLDQLIRLEGVRKIVAIMGSLHTLKGLDWESAGKGKTPSIRSQLALRYPDRAFFQLSTSLAMLIAVVILDGNWPVSRCLPPSIWIGGLQGGP